MDLKNRIERLENLIGVSDEIQPLIIINVADQSKGSTDLGSARMAIVPGKLGGPHGITMFRDKDEDPGNFLERCESKHTEIYG